MPWEADIIHALQLGMSNSFNDFIMKALTLLGDEVFVIGLMMLLFWCVSKRTGFKFLNIYFCTVAINTLLKNIFRRTRPFDVYPDRVESIGEKSSGYSFPSGHTNSITTLATLSCIEYKKYTRVLLPVCIAVVLIVMFTRMYLGQHYLTDVLVSAVVAIGLSILFNYLYSFLGDKEERLGYVVAPIALIAAIVIGIVGEGDLVKKTLELTGVMIAVYIGYFIEKKYIKFNEKAFLWQHIVKCLIGGAVVLLLYIGLKYAFMFDTSYWLYGFFRFFLMGAWLTLGAPYVFKRMNLYKEENKEENTKEEKAESQENLGKND